MILLHLPSNYMLCSYVTEHVYRYNAKDAVVLDIAQGVPAA